MDEQVSGGLQHVVIVNAVVIQFGILHFYRFVFHVCLDKLIKITINTVLSMIALDLFSLQGGLLKRTHAYGKVLSRGNSASVIEN